MGKGSSKGHTPREAKDNLKSTQLLSVIDAISEGPIEGPVDGLKSVLLNSTPVLDSEGNTNISGVTVVFRAGEQEQTPPEGFESSGSETVLGTEVKYDTPITWTITSANIDRLRVTFGVQALVETTSKGDRNPSEVRLLVQIQRNGGWVTEKDITIKGKTTSQYLASVVVGNLPPRPFSIRMRRMTPDSTTDQLQNKTLWSSYTEIIDVKQCYPNTALVGVQVDSEQPCRSADGSAYPTDTRPCCCCMPVLTFRPRYRCIAASAGYSSTAPAVQIQRNGGWVTEKDITIKGKTTSQYLASGTPP